MSFFGSFLFKLVLTVIISIFIGFQLAKIEFKEYNHSFRKILGVEVKGDAVLERKIQAFLEGKQGDYAVYVKDLKPGGKRNVYINSDQVFEAASLYKLFLMVAAYEAVNKGEITLDTEISAKLSHLEGILGSVDYGYQHLSGDEVATYTVRECLDRIARISDNYAAIMLAEKIGWDSAQEVANEIGALNTTIKTPISTSAEDVGLLLEKIYKQSLRFDDLKGEIVTFEASEEMIGMLEKAQINDRIPAKLPKGVRIAHKTGELSRVRNDAGIVFLEGNPLGSQPEARTASSAYVIVEMSKNLKYEDEGIENLAEISKIVFDYYSGVGDN